MLEMQLAVLAGFLAGGSTGSFVAPRRSMRLTSDPRMASAFSWQDSECTDLNLLPFSLDDLLLPGETKQVHLYEARFLELFTQAEKSDHGCVGQLLILPNGGVVANTALLEIEESRKQDIGVWARLRCVGRVEIEELEPTDYDYYRATVKLITDSPSEPVGVETLNECMEAHASCHELVAKLEVARGSSDAAGSEEGDELPLDERVEWGHEGSASSDFSTPLPKLLETRRDMLCSRGLDAPAASGLDYPMQKLWGAQTESEAEAMLLSFSASSYLSPKERAVALGETDTLERVQRATATFRETGRRLAAELALAEAVGQGGASSESES